MNKLRKARGAKITDSPWFTHAKDLLAVLEDGQWLPPGMQYASDMLHLILPKDAQDLVYSIWRIIRFVFHTH
jgi:hypothetical protein